MPFYNGEKWACSSCTKGHRSSKCMHTDRILYKVRKPGRPLNSCPHTFPEKIKPGTFVNTSPTSMAGGNSSKEACGCKGEQVEVAIPKMKHCSCTTAGDSSEAPPQTPNPENGSGVKSGRVVKKSNRRKKSALSDEALGAVKEDVGMNDTAKTPSSGTAPTLTHTLPIYPGFPPHQGSSLLVHHNPATGQHLPTIPMHDVPPRWQPQSVFMNGVPSTLGASAQNHLSVNNQMTPTAQHQTQNQFPMATPAGSSMMMNNVPWQSPDFFGGVPKTEAPQMAEHDNSSVPVVMAAFNPTPHMNALTLNNDKIMVPLTHDEYIWIQHARTAGVDFSKLPKFIPEQRENTLEAHNLTPCSIPQPSPMHFPANMATAQPTPVTHSMPEPTKPKAGGCCKSKSVPSITTTATAEILPSPSSPRCKCGDACRCVPCADHPFNPAMLETIKGDMLLLQDPNNKKPSSCCSTSTPTHQPDNETSNSPAMYDQDTYGDKNSPANTGDAGIMADFNFVFQNYNYGSGCTEGRGGCMCGEGCTCVGCLTHGGHDGVIFNILGDTATNTAMGHVNENTNAASTPREEHQHQNQHHQQHNQQNQQTDQNHRA